ncbi:MAG: hypothetical protein JWM41_2633 [Gemmatimonadetes bacterium]|nr:hypothetical protein [Gemmatimonadota bacterium]
MSGRHLEHLIRSSALLLVCLVCLLSRRAAAQSTTSLLPDATVLPQRALRFRALSGWTRYDELLGNGGTHNVAAPLATDSLTPLQIPAFSSIQSAIAAASGLSAFRLTAGRLTAAADSRIVTAPLIVEYGLTSRLTLGIVVPLVETRTTLEAQLNPKLGSATVGPNPALTSSAVLGQNAAFVQSMTAAATSLNARLTQCQGAPSGTGCGSLLAQQSAVQSLIQTTNTLAPILARVYGTTKDNTQAFIPLATDPSQLAIAARIKSLSDQYTAFLGGNPISGTLAGANGRAANIQLQNLLTSLGHDTLQSTDHSGIGDITVGAVYQLANTFGDSTATGRQYRVALNGNFRIGTGKPANRNRFFDLATGYGQPGIEAGVAADVRLRGRLSASAIGSYTLQLGSVAVSGVPNSGDAVYPLTLPTPGTYSAGNVMSLSVIPRYQVAGYLGLTGRYSFVHVGADQYAGAPSAGLAAQTAQQIGLGITYSTVVSRNRGPGAIPFEASFTHLETIAGSGGPTPKTFQDQIELRVFLPRR